MADNGLPKSPLRDDVEDFGNLYFLHSPQHQRQVDEVETHDAIHLPACEPAADRVARQVLNALAAGVHIQAEGAVARAGVDCDSVDTARAADFADGGTGYADGSGRSVR